MTLSGLGLLTMWEFPRGRLLFCIYPSLNLFFVLYSGLLVFPLASCLQNLHFPIILPPNIRIFPLLAVSITDKPVNRSIHAYDLTLLNVFALRACIFLGIDKKKQEGIRAIRAIKYKKKGWKIYLRTHTFGAEVHKSNIRVKRWHNKYENSELDWKTQLLFKWFAYQVQSYWNRRHAPP